MSGDMIISTTPTIEGRTILQYHGIVVGEVILGVNIIRDIFARFRDFFGGRAKSYERKMSGARETAFAEMKAQAVALGANAIVGVDLDYEIVGGSMLLISASGTAVRLES